MPITDQRAINLANNWLRPTTDAMVSAHDTIARFRELLTSLPEITALIPNDPNEVFVDGSPGDGRQQITGQEAHDIYQMAQDFAAWANANPTGRTRSRINILRSVSVNGGPKF